MSIEIDWDTLTGGPDGEALAETIREFVHDRFQKVALPRMIRSVEVHAFSFGSTKPDVELKDVCDPLPDFYDDEEDTEDQSSAATPKSTPESSTPRRTDEPSTRRDTSQSSRQPMEGRSNRLSTLMTEGLMSMSPTRAATPRLPGGMSNLGYFHLPLSAGLSGASTPLAAVAGARFPGWTEQHQHQHQPSSSSGDSEHPSRGRSHSSITPPLGSSRPGSSHDPTPIERLHSQTSTPANRSAEDLQVMARIAYDGDVKLSLTAEILLDYPTPSFVGIPLKLHITGVKFDGIAILAHIKKKAHFCFLSPEDAETLVDAPPGETRTAAGGLIEEIRVESEIGQKDGGKQVLKNVGKIEKFILEQVRKIFEDEFVYPSFWTFLV